MFAIDNRGKILKIAWFCFYCRIEDCLNFRFAAAILNGRVVCFSNVILSMFVEAVSFLF